MKKCLLCNNEITQYNYKLCNEHFNTFSKEAKWHKFPILNREEKEKTIFYIELSNKNYLDLRISNKEFVETFLNDIKNYIYDYNFWYFSFYDKDNNIQSIGYTKNENKHFVKLKNYKDKEILIKYLQNKYGKNIVNKKY